MWERGDIQRCTHIYNFRKTNMDTLTRFYCYGIYILTIFYLLEMLGTKTKVNFSYCEVEEYLLSLKKFSVSLKVTEFLLGTLADRILDQEPLVFEHELFQYKTILKSKKGKYKCCLT